MECLFNKGSKSIKCFDIAFTVELQCPFYVGVDSDTGLVVNGTKGCDEIRGRGNCDFGCVITRDFFIFYLGYVV